jgi:hypothetical protein
MRVHDVIVVEEVHDTCTTSQVWKHIMFKHILPSHCNLPVGAVMTYTENNNIQPGTAYWRDTLPYSNLVATLNSLFSKSYTRIRFRLDQVSAFKCQLL